MIHINKKKKRKGKIFFVLFVISIYFHKLLTMMDKIIKLHSLLFLFNNFKLVKTPVYWWITYIFRLEYIPAFCCVKCPKLKIKCKKMIYQHVCFDFHNVHYSMCMYYWFISLFFCSWYIIFLHFIFSLGHLTQQRAGIYFRHLNYNNSLTHSLNN
jgi:hypothetical protein